jgi:hypothetical protein
MIESRICGSKGRGTEGETRQYIYSSIYSSCGSIGPTHERGDQAYERML